MAFPGDPEVDLILALQAATGSDRGWSGFLARLATVTGARFAAMISYMPGGDEAATITSVSASGAPMAVDEAALRTILADTMRAERIYAADELADAHGADGPARIDAALAALGAAAVRAVRIVVPDALSIVVGIFGTGAFAAADGAVLRRLFPYLQAAARAAAVLTRERSRARITADLARRACLAWFLLDRAGHVMEAWVAPPGLPPGIRIVAGQPGGRLLCEDRAADAAVAAAIDRIAAGGVERTQAVRLRRGSMLHLRIAAAPPASRTPASPSVMLTLHGELRLVPDAAALMIDLFGLLPSEARLAAELGRGKRLATAAADLGLTTMTARNYSKTIFAKAGARGQTDLVRLMFASGLAEPD